MISHSSISDVLLYKLVCICFRRGIIRYIVLIIRNVMYTYTI